MGDNERGSDNNNSDENHMLAMYGCDDKWSFSKRELNMKLIKNLVISSKKFSATYFQVIDHRKFT